MNKQKKIIITILLIIEVGLLCLCYKSYSNKNIFYDELKNNNSNTFALYIQEDDDKYHLSRENNWPDIGYKLNLNLSYCKDVNNNIVSDVLSFEDNITRVKSKKTVMCFLYFDTVKKLYDVIKSESQISGGLALQYNGDYDLEETDPNRIYLDDNGDEQNYYIYYYTNTIDGNQYNETVGDLIKDKWNVVFGGYCWQMIRTTETGGVRLLYNGEPTVTINSKGKKVYKCLDNRGNHVGYGKREQSGFSSSLTYYFGTSYEYDEDSGKFSISGNISSSKWNSTTAPNLRGLYTCRLTNSTGKCNELYLIHSYKDDTTAYVYVLSNKIQYYGISTTYEEIIVGDAGGSPFNDMAGENLSLGFAGYMYNATYPYAIKSFQISFVNGAASEGLTNGRYNIPANANWKISSSYSYNSSYTLDNPVTIGTTNYEQYIGMYTTKSAKSSDSELYYIADFVKIGSLNYFLLVRLRDGYGPDHYQKSLFLSNELVEVSGRKRLKNPIAIYNFALPNDIQNIGDTWVRKYENYTGYYMCIDNESCTTPYTVNVASAIGIEYMLESSNIVYGNKISYNSNTGYYTISQSNANDYIKFWDISDVNNLNSLKDYHYTCFNTGGSCQTIFYVYYYRNDYSVRLYYIRLSNGKYVETDTTNINSFENDNNVIYEMLYSSNVNKIDSDAKFVIDLWYEKWQELYSSDLNNYIDNNTIYCNDRSISDFGSWDLHADNISGNNIAVRFTSSENSYKCSNYETDKFTHTSSSYGNKKLKYSVALATYAELMNIKSSDARSVNASYWTLTPDRFDRSSLTVNSIYSLGSSLASNLSGSSTIRPVISLKKDTEYSRGKGTRANPYIVGTN